ncbi:MAG: hypothetical protein IJD70_06865 [Clostridia bacterium]|nr:hypothetical protein [Clostridia bacterium]
MSTDRAINNRRLLEAIEYLDSKYIDEMFDDIKAPPREDGTLSTRRTPFKYWKQFTALAACMVLLAFSAPIFSYFSKVIGNWGAASGVGTTEVSTQAVEESSPFFWMYTPELEPLTQEQVDACNQAWRLKLCGTLEDYIASYPEGKEQKAENDYYDVMFISTTKSRPYLGTFNGAIVTAGLMIGITGLEVENVELGGHIIHFEHSGGISVYKDGTIIGIYEAYEREWLTDDDIEIISKRMDKFNQALN